MRLHRIARILLAGFATAVLLGTMGCGKQEKVAFATLGSKSDGANNKEIPLPKADFVITGEALGKEFLADPKAADAKYQNKVIELEGIVSTASQFICGEGGFNLEGAKKDPKDILGLRIVCQAGPAAKSRAGWLGEHQKVKVKGRYNGSRPDSVTLAECEFTELEPLKTPVVTAEQLTAEVAKDPEAAKKKYLIQPGYNEIIVEGTVADLVQARDLEFAKLAGSQPDQRVSFCIRKQEFDTLKKGQKVRFKGLLGSIGAGDKELGIDQAFLLKDK